MIRLRIFEWLTIVSLIVGMIMLAWFFYFQPPPIKVLRGWVDDYQVPRGQYAYFHYEAEKYRSCPGFSYFYINDSDEVIIRVESEGVGWNDEGTRTITYKVEIPKIAAIGPAEFWETITYDCTPFRAHIVRTPRIPFEIIHEAAPG